MQTDCILSPHLYYSSTNFDIFNVQNSEFFRILVANKIFHVTVLLRVYFCDQFVAPEIRHSSDKSIINMVFSDENKILIKHINTLRMHSRRVIKIGALKMQFV